MGGKVRDGGTDGVYRRTSHHWTGSRDPTLCIHPRQRHRRRESGGGEFHELKNVILFDRVQVPHYNYVGDSILGYKSHMGAGSITSNVKSDKKLVEIRIGDYKIETRMKKVGAMLGDYVEVGCGSILNPGSVVGRHTNIYPLSSVRGYVEANSIYKKRNEIVPKDEY